MRYKSRLEELQVGSAKKRLKNAVAEETCPQI
jgi:hypothetical protein